MCVTCPVARVVEVHPEGSGLMLALPRQRGAVLVVGVGVVVVDVPGKSGGYFVEIERYSVTVEKTPCCI